jgi:siroheme synthase
VAVSNASLGEERVVVGTIGTLAARIRAAELASPATLIIGEVARRALESHPDAGAEQDHPEDFRATGGALAAAEVA